MVGDGEARRLEGERQLDIGEQFGDVLGQPRDARSLVPIGRVLTQHEAVILDRGAAARCIDHHRIEPAIIEHSRPGIDIGARRSECLFLLAHMMGQRSAAAHARGDHHLEAESGQKPHGGLVDLRCESLLRTPVMSAHTTAPLTHGRVRAGQVDA